MSIFRSIRHVLVATPTLIAVIAFGIVEWLALSRARVADRMPLLLR
jgi:hypothetical protein